MVQIITDSSCDLPYEIIEKYNINVVPLNIRINGKEYEEGVNITSKEFQSKMLASKELPKTSQPSPALFAKTFEKLSEKGKILCITISSGLSGTYQAACIGRDMSGKDVEVFDTLAGSLGHGLQIIKAAELSQMGHSVEDIIEKLEEYKKRMKIFILLDTLENIVKGGRLSRFQGSLAKILDIKVLLEGVEGKVEMLRKIRGRKKFLEDVIAEIGRRETDFSDKIIGITHVANREDAEYIKNELIKLYRPKDVIINYMGATMGTYAGKGGMIISF